MKVKPFAIITDIDETITAQNVLKTSFKELVTFHRDQFWLIYVTASTLKDSLTAIKDGLIPKPDLLFSDIGTTYFSFTKEFRFFYPFYDELFNFPRSYIVRALSRNRSFKIQNIYSLYRVSYDILRNEMFIPKYSNLNPVKSASNDCEEEELICPELNALKALNVDLIFSRNYLDVLPKWISKKSLVEFLIKEYFSDCKIFLSGNSLNDNHMFIKPHNFNLVKICVPNADNELIFRLGKDENVFFKELDEDIFNIRFKND